MKIKISFLIFIVFVNFCFSQNTFDIIFPKTDVERNQKCQRCVQMFQQKPKEVYFSIERERNNLYFKITDKNWFLNFFKNPTDGMAIDVIDKNRYDCANDTIVNEQIRGMLLKPIYAQRLKSGLKEDGDAYFRVFVGKLPDNYLKRELEYNILFLNNKTFCRYQTIYNLESYPWELLGMGMYLDSLTFSTKKITTVKEGYVLKQKTLVFTIPFKKNKADYSPEDIKPLYDSLRLTDFNIKTINIRAYASVEGTLERNKELQTKRAASIAKALQSFQEPTVVTNIQASENWVEFLNDISESKYSYIKQLNKAEIKNRLASGLSEELESYLKNHRKAVIKLELERKDNYKDISEEALILRFNKALNEDELEQATEIQNAIFERIKRNNISPDLLHKMNIPKQERFVKIFNKNSAFRFMRDIREGLIVHNELKELEKLAPKDPKLKYNIVATTFPIWRYNWMKINELDFEKQIKNLRNYGIHASLIDRMLVNFHIVKAEKYMQKRNYGAKDKSIDFIKAHYNNFPLSDFDYLSLAQFLTYYSKSEDAVGLLSAKARSIDINVDLLFYYLNLTLVDKALTKDEDYRTIMLNAINMNKERYCKLFNNKEKGGVTFQLLENEYLRKTYCENCND